MCKLYRMTSSVSEMAKLYGSFEGDRTNMPERGDIYPAQSAPIITATESGLALKTMTWGVPGWKEGMRPITNVRNLTSGFWKNMIANPANRCLVPVSAFCEWTGEKGSKRKVWFGLTEQPLFSFAGIWRDTSEGPCMAFLTCEPNALVEPIHPKAMPVILEVKDYPRWMTGGFDEVVQLARPFDTGKMEIVE